MRSASSRSAASALSPTCRNARVPASRNTSASLHTEPTTAHMRSPPTFAGCRTGAAVGASDMAEGVEGPGGAGGAAVLTANSRRVCDAPDVTGTATRAAVIVLAVSVPVLSTHMTCVADAVRQAIPGGGTAGAPGNGMSKGSDGATATTRGGVFGTHRDAGDGRKARCASDPPPSPSPLTHTRMCTAAAGAWTSATGWS